MDNTELSKLQKLLKHKKSTEYYCEKLGITEEYLEELKKELRKQETHDTIEDLESFEKTTRVNNEKGTLESTLILNEEPKDDIELAKLHKIDLNKYKISNYWSKVRPNGKFTSSVLASLKKPADYTPEDFINFLSNWKLKDIQEKGHIFWFDKDKEFVDIELNIADFHLAKKTYQGDSLVSKELDYYKVVNGLLDKVKRLY